MTRHDPLLHGTLVRYLKCGGSWYLIDSVTHRIVRQYSQVGVIWHRLDGVLCHGAAETVLQFYPRYTTGVPYGDVKFVYFTVDDSAHLLNQLVTDVLAAQLLFAYQPFDVLKKCDLN